MTGTERIRALLDGTELDRTPVSGWYHMPLVDTNAEKFVDEIILSTDKNQWDLIKIMTNAHFYTEAYGGRIRFSEAPDKWRGTVLEYPVRTPEDLFKLPVLPNSNPVWQRELRILKKLKEHYKDTIPVLSTVFSPLTALQDCIGCMNPAPVLKLMVEEPKAFHHALEAVTQTNLIYLDGIFSAGADGIFLANQYAAGLLTDEQYEEFCAPYEARILEHCKGHTWFNMAHIHGTGGLHIDRYLSYGDDILQAVNWENCPAGVPEEEVTSIAGVRSKTNKVIAAGIDNFHDFTVEGGRTDAVRKRLEARYLKACQENGGNRFIFAPGCVLATGGSDLNRLIYETADKLGKTNYDD